MSVPYKSRHRSSLPRLISLPDAARSLNVTANRLYTLVRDRKVSHVRWPGNGRVRTNIYFREADLERLLEAMTVKPRRQKAAPVEEPRLPPGLSSVEECAFFGVDPDPEFQDVDVPVPDAKKSH